MPDSITIIVSAISTILGAGLAVMALKSRSERKLHGRETEIAALRAKEAVLAERQQELAAQNTQLQADLSAKNNEFASLQGRKLVVFDRPECVKVRILCRALLLGLC